MKRREDYGVLEKLVKLFGPISHEEPVQEYFEKLMAPFADEIYRDRLKNSYAIFKGNPKYLKVMMNAHADTIGFMIKHIDDLGFIFVNDLWDNNQFDHRLLAGTDVIIEGRAKGKKKRKRVKGHFNTTKPVHLVSEDEMMDSVDREDVIIDIGAKDRAQAERYISIGDYIVMSPHFRYSDINGGRHFTATGLDDRAGLYVLYRLAKEIANKSKRNRAPIVLVSTATEEGGNGAAKAAARYVKPDVAITIDGTPATDQIRENNEDTIAKQFGQIFFDRGPAIARGIGVDNDLFSYLEDLCEGGKIDYQTEVGCGGTENLEIQVAGEGVQTALVSIPMRNLHTRVETISLGDLESTIRLCYEFYKGVSRGDFR